MKIIFFKEESHEYKSEDGEGYESVSRVFKPYQEQFNTDFNSSRSAFKEMDIDVYKTISRKHGWDNPKLIEYLMETLEPSRMDAFLDIKGRFIKTWADKGNSRRDIGTRVHASEEDSEIKSGYGFNPYDKKMYKTFTSRDLCEEYSNKSIHKGNPFKDLEDGYYPEILLSSDEYGIAGQQDRFFIESIGPYRFIDIDDLKTDEFIYKIPDFFHPKKGHKRLQKSLNYLLDTNYNTYSIKITFYAYLAKMWGFIPRNLGFTNLNMNYETEEILSKDLYRTPYREKIVKRMLKEYINGK